MVRRYVSTVLPIGCFWKSRSPQTGEHMVEVKRIKAPSDIPAEGSYVLVLYGPSAMDREHPRDAELSWCGMASGTRRSLTSLPQPSRPPKTLRKPNISRPST